MPVREMYGLSAERETEGEKEKEEASRQRREEENRGSKAKAKIAKHMIFSFHHFFKFLYFIPV